MAHHLDIRPLDLHLSCKKKEISSRRSKTPTQSLKLDSLARKHDPFPPQPQHLRRVSEVYISPSSSVTPSLTCHRNQFPTSKITAATLAGRNLYLVFDADLAAQIYRATKNFAYDPLVLAVAEAFGCSKQDLKVLVRDGPSSSPSPSTGSNDLHHLKEAGLLDKLHKMTASRLQGPSLDAMTSIFISTLTSNLEAAFPETSPEDGEWKEVELVEFIKKQWTLASIASLFGTQILEKEGPDAMYDWLWDLDIHVQSLMTQVPDLLIRKATRSREKGLEMLIAWERAAKNAEEKGIINDQGAWDEYYGLNFVRDRAQLAESEGVSERGRAALQVALLWGQNANAIPVSAWLAIQALSPQTRDLLPILLDEIAASMTGEDRISLSLDFSKLSNQPHLNSLLQETYRWSVSSPSVRIVRSDTVIGEYLLQKGGLVLLQARTMQLNPDVWGEDAHLFNPSRFLDARSEETKKEQLRSMRPFGGGSHMCPGRHFAGNEILGGFAVLMRMLEIEVLDHRWVEPMAQLGDAKQGGLWPDRGVVVRMRRRKMS